MIGTPDKINKYLDAAMAQRSKFIVLLPPALSSIKDLSASLEAFDSNTIQLEVSALKHGNQGWIDHVVKCYFNLIVKKEQQRQTFLNFTSQLLDVKTNRSGFVDLILKYPSRLDVGQRRSSIRVEVDQKLVCGFHVWEEDRFLRRSNGKVCLHPPLISNDDLASQAARIQDISAGGLKLCLKSNTASKSCLNWEKGHSMIILIVLSDPHKGTNEQHWLKAYVKFKHEDFVTKDVDLGIAFSRVGKIMPDKKMCWISVEGHHVDAIGNWAYQRYLELYRKGLVL
jgi:c-di-GMP-binding flagellar brake protein YcgR